MAVFRDSGEGILTRKERNRQYMKEYYNRPGARERRKQYRQKPKIREQIKQWGREYRQRPEVRERKRRYDKEYRQRPDIREWRKRQAKMNRKKLKSMLFQFFGGKCSHCGCDDLRALEINHVNGGGSKEHQLRGGYVFYADILSGKRKTDDLELLCAVCNAHHHMKVLKGVSGDWKIEWKPHNKGGEMLG